MRAKTVEVEGNYYTVEEITIGNRVGKYRMRLSGKLNQLLINDKTVAEVERKLENVSIGTISIESSGWGEETINIENIKDDIGININVGNIDSIRIKGCSGVNISTKGNIKSIRLTDTCYRLSLPPSKIDSIEVNGDSSGTINTADVQIKELKISSKSMEMLKMTNVIDGSARSNYKGDRCYLSLEGKSKVGYVSLKGLGVLSLSQEAKIEVATIEQCGIGNGEGTSTIKELKTKNTRVNMEGMLGLKPEIILMNEETRVALYKRLSEEEIKKLGVEKIIKYPGRTKAEQIERRRETMGKTGTWIYLY